MSPPFLHPTVENVGRHRGIFHDQSKALGPGRRIPPYKRRRVIFSAAGIFSIRGERMGGAQSARKSADGLTAS